jgi:hypothetical protein
VVDPLPGIILNRPQRPQRRLLRLRGAGVGGNMAAAWLREGFSV